MQKQHQAASSSSSSNKQVDNRLGMWARVGSLLSGGANGMHLGTQRRASHYLSHNWFKGHVWFEFADTFASPCMSSPWSARASLDVGEPLRFGLASKEQRWGIVGASCGVALGDLR